MKKTAFLIATGILVLAGCSHNTNAKPSETAPLPANTNVTQNNNTVKETAQQETSQNSPSQATTNTATKTTSNNKSTVSEKQDYLNKLDNIQNNMKDLDEMEASGATTAVKSAEGLRYERWDKALNEIYGVLKKELPASEFAQLQKEELKWIVFRDQTAINESQKYGNGSQSFVQYNTTESRLTKNRCYELVNKYMSGTAQSSNNETSNYEVADSKLPVGQKQEYLNKLDNIEKNLKYLDEDEASGITSKMRNAESAKYDKWDAALNEIYGMLKKELPPSEMAKLQKEEIQWISYKEEKAKKESSVMAGGTGEYVIYDTSITDSTRERCYQLVNEYMK